MGAWKLTIRHGSKVRREHYDSLERAVEEIERRVEEIRGEGPLKAVSMLREFEPVEQVAARLEISGKGLLRPPTAGVDVKGDGSIVAFRGAVRRQPLEPRRGGSPFDAVREALGDGR